MHYILKSIMRILIQRVKSANVIVENKEVAAIEGGLLLFVAIGKDDTIDDLGHLAQKVLNLRIFEDEAGKINLSSRHIGGQILSVSQFSLYADTQKGNRPGFEPSAEPRRAKELWEKFNDLLIEEGAIVKQGLFGVDMQVGLVNDGPFTIWLDSDKDTLGT